MGWGNVTGDEQILPSGGSNEIILESGKVKRVRALLEVGEEPYSFFQHTLEVENTDNGQTTRVFRTVNCPKTKQNPYAPCKLCDGQQANRRVRHAIKAWDFDQGTARFLAGGEKIFLPMATLHKMGIDPSTVDWAILRTGKGRNDTDYSVQNLGVSQFTLPEGANTLKDPREEYRPHTEAEMQAIVEGMGLSWASMIVPPPLKYQNSLQEALDHVVPNTKYKGQSMKQIWETNRGMIEFFSNSDRVTPEKSAAQIILVALGGANIPGVPNFGAGGNGAITTPTTPTGPTAPSTTTTPTTPTTPAVDSGGSDNKAKIEAINKLLQSNEKFVKGGYSVIIDTMKLASNGKVSINEFTSEELDKMLELCK